MTKIHIILLVILSILIFTQCKKDSNTYVEKINPACMCTEQYEPVCGCNGITYGNACQAECFGIINYTLGEC